MAQQWLRCLMLGAVIRCQMLGVVAVLPNGVDRDGESRR